MLPGEAGEAGTMKQSKQKLNTPPASPREHQTTVDSHIQVGVACCYCHARASRFEIAFCATCLAPHHPDCFKTNGECAILGCNEQRLVHRQSAPQRASLRPLVLVGIACLLGGWGLHGLFSPETPRTRPPISDPPLAHVEPLNQVLPDTGTVEIDMTTGVIRGQHHALTFVTAPRDSDGDGAFEAVLKANLLGVEGLQVDVTFSDRPSDWSLNIGDSSTNNGAAGDGCTQTNDAELDVFSGEIRVWANDDLSGPEKTLATETAIAKPGATVSFVVRDGSLAWRSGDNVGGVSSPHLFALAGQPDREGPVNHDIFVGINRVISSSYRRGAGVAKVSVRVLE
jgi:hypothetical protein